MAYQRPTQSVILGDSLDSFVSGISTMFKNQLAVRNAADELNFNTQVLRNNLSLKDQLAYRNAQLERVSDDPNEASRIKGEISTLTDRIEQQDFSDKYAEKVTAYGAGTESIDSLLSWLNDSLSSATDLTIQNNLRQSIESYTQKRFELTQTMLKDQTEYAVQDKTASIVNGQISKVQAAKASALLAGDNATAASLDLQLQSLNKALSDNAISKDIKDIAVATSSGYSKATDLLSLYNSKIQGSDTQTPVTVNGVTYQSAQEYWTYARNSYLSENTPSGFFPRIDDEQTTAIKVKNSNNTLTTADLQNAASLYDSLRTYPELANFASKIDTAKADTLQTAADFLATKVANNFDNTLDLTSAVNSLNALKGMGVNVDNAYQKILSTASSSQNDSLSRIISAATTLMSTGMSASDAIAQAIKTGSGVILSPNDLIGKTPAQNAATILGNSEKGASVEDSRTTMGGSTPSAAPGIGGYPAGTVGAEITGTPTGPFVTIGGKNYAYNAAAATPTSPASPSTPGSVPGTGVVTPIAGDKVSTLRAQISAGTITPQAAYDELTRGMDQYSIQQNNPRQALFGGLGTIQLPGGQYGTIDLNGVVTRLSTEVHQTTVNAEKGTQTPTVSAQNIPPGANTPNPAPTVQPASQQPKPPVATTTPPVAPVASAPSTPNPTPAPAPTPTPATPPAYSGVSIVDYLSSLGKSSDYGTRSQLAAAHGITGYVGSADQNTQLLKALRGY